MLLLTKPEIRRWTKAEYHQMADIGFFEGQRVELIGGEVVEMPPQKNSHAISLLAVYTQFIRLFGEQYLVRVQLPMDIDAQSEPEPDVLVMEGTLQQAIETNKDHPKAAILIVEVSESTLSYDRGRKAGLYASRGVQDYWIVNLLDKQLEIRRAPVADAAEQFGFRYDQITILKSGEMAKPLAIDAEIPVAQLIPKF